MNSAELNSLLLKRFPVLKDAFEEETSWQEGIDTGAIVVFEDIFMPYIIYCAENNLKEQITRRFDFIEECVRAKDSFQKTVIEVSNIENIHSYDIANKLAFLGEESLKSYNNNHQ